MLNALLKYKIMFSCATKFYCVSNNINKLRSSVDLKRYTLRTIDVAKIPVILSKYVATEGPCGGSSSPPGKSAGGASKNQIVYKAYKPPPYRPHDYKNMHLKRPMSPHLFIYAPTLPAMTSIGQRATGVVATFYAIVLSTGALFLSNGVDSIVSAIQSLEMGRFSVFIIKLILGAPFAFHYFNGVRFVAFNMGKFFMKKEVYGSAHKAIIASVVLTIVFSIL
nr:succinate dehydrogenase cytochrome b560 subunit, mitochondrial-like [Plodia interpunctella]